MSDTMTPDFDKLADELLEDVAQGHLPNDTRDLLATHGRLMYAAGIRAAAELANNELGELLESAACDAENGTR
jgi:hypothetical protein